MRARLVAACFVACATTSAIAGVARANGRFPFANQVVVDPGDASHLVLRTSYGFLQSFDAGASWQWLCEKSVGYSGTYDPAIAVTDKGTILAGLLYGVSVGTSRGCDFHSSPSTVLQKQDVIDVTVSKSDPSRAVAVTSTAISGADAGFNVVVAATTDDGATWTQQGTAIPVDFVAETIDVAPSDDKRIYVGGFHGTPHVPSIERSDDGGATWRRLDVGVALGCGHPPCDASAFIGAVDPKDPDRVYVRLDLADWPRDLLVVTKDGGKTWETVFTAKEKLLGFALSPDGSQVAVGSTKDGVHVASTTDLAFTLRSCITTTCLAWADAGLYACGIEYPDCFTLALSTDRAQSWKPLYHLSDLSQLSCPSSSTTGSLCPAFWDDPVGQGVVQTLGVGSEPAECVADAAPGEAGCFPPALDSGAEKGAEHEPSVPSPSNGKSGCGCAVVGASGVSSAGLAALVLLVARTIRRRNRTRGGA